MLMVGVQKNTTGGTPSLLFVEEEVVSLGLGIAPITRIVANLSCQMDAANVLHE
jgi:hypothetical protein